MTVCSVHSAASVTSKQFHTGETVWQSMLEKVIVD